MINLALQGASASAIFVALTHGVGAGIGECAAMDHRGVGCRLSLRGNRQHCRQPRHVGWCLMGTTVGSR